MAHDHGHAHADDHAHAHDHAHGDGHAHRFDHPHHHGHQITDSKSEGRIAIAAVLTGAFMVVEVGGGIVAGSLALIADAGHMLSDFGSLVLAWVGFRIARRPADTRRTYGFRRFAVLAAFVNGLALFAVAAWIVFEAAMRIATPHAVLAGPMLWIASAGLLVNIVAFAVLHGADHSNLNVRGALLHVAGDLLGSVAAIGAAAIIMTTGWTVADPILSVLVALILLRSAWGLTKDSSHILLEGAPAHVDVEAVAKDLAANVPGVIDIHHAHAWSLDEKQSMMTLHARIPEGASGPEIVAKIKARLKETHGVGHATVEIETGDCAGADCA
jgi:cobalt-zinc-cadmium efflux system protein